MQKTASLPQSGPGAVSTFVCLLLTGWLLLGLSPQGFTQTVLEKKFSARLPAASLAQRLKTLQQQTGVTIAFDEKETAGNEIAALDLKNVTVKEALQRSLSQLPFTWKLAGNSIVIIARPRPAAPQAVPGKVTGRVIDAGNGLPVGGASVRIGNKGATSNDEGIFSIPVTPGRYTLEVSYVGYLSKKLPAVEITEAALVLQDISLEKEKGNLSEVVVRADRLVTTNNNKLVYEVQKATGVVSGISSEQITISVDRSASEVARRVAGVTLQDGFISIRGMTPRYNPVFLNNAFLPSTDPNKRAFNFDLLPSSVIDRMLVYKSAAPELPGDFAGGVVKVYTKKSVPLRRLEISLNAQYRTGNKFFDNHMGSSGGKYDWLGYDDGTRATPKNLPRNPYGELLLPRVETFPNTYSRTNEVITDAFLQRSMKAWNLKEIYHPADLQGDLTYYTYVNIGSLKLNSVSVGRYENQRSYFRSPVLRDANRFEPLPWKEKGELVPIGTYNFRKGYDSIYTASVKMAGMQHFTLVINPRHEIGLMGLYNHNTKEALQINTIEEWSVASRPSLYFRRFESAYNMQDLYMGMLNGSHKMGGNKHLLEWSASYSETRNEDPNQFSNVYEPDDASIIGDVEGIGKLNLTENTTWRFVGAERRNTVVGRFMDGEGSEKRKQANIDYTIRPLQGWNDFLVRTGGYIESRRKKYFYSALGYSDFPNFSFSKTPWMNFGDTLQKLIGKTNTRMHTMEQSVGVGDLQTNGYEARYENIAGYLAANLPFSFRNGMKLDVYGGVRLEYSERKVLNTKGEEFVHAYGAGTTGRVIVSSATPPFQHFWLPSVSATLHFNDYWQLRMSYGKTLNRPELRELSPYLTYNPAEGYTYMGDPTLHDARIDNYDLRLEWYPSPGEAVSAGFYYKDIAEPIEEMSALTNTGVSGFKHGNLPFARIYGAELEVRKQLAFVGGSVFRHMGIILNACVNYTEASNKADLVPYNMENVYPGGNLRSFMGAAPWIINMGLFYDNKSSGSRFSLQYNACADRMLANTAGINVKQLEPWSFERTRHLLDLSLLQRVNKWLSIRVAAQNLLNSAIRQYVDNDFNKKYNEKPSYFEWTVNETNGPKTYEYVQGDFYFRNYKPGVYYTLGFQFSLQGNTSKKQK